MEEIMLFAERVIPDLLRGTKVTIQLSLVALGIGLLVGLPVGIIRTYGNRWLRKVATGYVTLFRGTPLLIQLFLVYYGLPDVGITFPRFEAAVITLGLNSSAYQAEYFRGALQAVGQGQILAGRAIGLSQLGAIRHVVLPQAVRIAIPAWSNEVVVMLKYTAVVFLIAVPELMAQAKILAGRYFNQIPVYLTVALFYLVLVAIVTLFLRFLEKRLEIPGLRMEGERH